VTQALASDRRAPASDGWALASVGEALASGGGSIGPEVTGTACHASRNPAVHSRGVGAAACGALVTSS
jgi:hypothetical protein